MAVQDLVSSSRGQVAGETMGALLSEAARRFATNAALVMKPGVRTRITTYAELERLAERCAHYLRERGIEKGDRVMIWAPNMPQWVGLYFGCLKIGGVVVPLDVRSEPQFAAAVVAQTEPKLIVAPDLRPMKV